MLPLEPETASIAVSDELAPATETQSKKTKNAIAILFMFVLLLAFTSYSKR
jgi:hypothetical protein